MTHKNGSSYEFGTFILDTKQGLLLRGTEPVKLPAKTFELLLFFVRHANQVIDKETLMAEVWKDSFVEDANLAVHISNLRKILNGDVNGSSAIETFPKIGYRFNADVRIVKNADIGANGEKTETDRENRNEREATPNYSDSPLRSRLFFLSLVVILLIGSGYALNRWLAPQFVIPPTMTRVPGMEQSSLVAFSPNGEYIASSATKDGKYTLMITNIGSGGSLQLMPSDNTGYSGLTFSKDSSFLYFIKAGRDESPLYRIPILGGNPVKILENVDNRISFSPDGQNFCFVRELSAGEYAIVVANADGRGERVVTTKKAPEVYSPYEIAWSPNGKMIAIAAGNSKVMQSMRIVSVDLDTGEEKPISDVKWAAVDGLDWLPDGSGVIAGVAETGSSPYQVWFIPYLTGQPYRITNDLLNYGAVSVSADGKTIMAGQFKNESRLWLGQNEGAERPKPLTTERRHFFQWVRWTHDGRLLFGSDLTGNKEIWIMNADGTGERQLTENESSDVMPAASDDGRYIVFTSNRGEESVSKLWRMDLNGVDPEPLTDGAGNQPSISPDGKWVFYTAGKIDGPKPERTIWKVPIDGGEPVQFLKEPAYGPDISPDGKFLATWYKPDKETQWKAAIFSINGGTPLKLLDLPEGPPVRWTADGKSISYLTTREGVTNIWSQPVDGGPAKPVTQFTSERISNFDWSPDGRLVCSRTIRTTEIVLIRNFR